MSNPSALCRRGNGQRHGDSATNQTSETRLTNELDDAAVETGQAIIADAQQRSETKVGAGGAAKRGSR